MIIACATQPAPGHFLLMTGLLRALQARGHQVTVLSSPAFGSFVESRGFAFRGVGRPWLAAQRAPLPFTVGESPTAQSTDYSFAETAIRDSFGAATAVLDDLSPDLLLREPTEFGVTFAAERAGIPLTTIGIGFLRTGDRLMADGGSRLLRLRAEAGLPAAPADLDALSRRRYVQTTPPSFEQVPQALTMMRAVDRDVAHAPREPRLLVTLGTLVNRKELLTRVLAELARIPVDCVLAAGDRAAEIAEHAPAHVEVQPFADLGRLAAGCTALVCHGGFGSILHALVYGLPVIVIPYNADQEWNAQRIRAIGAGRRVGWDELGDGALAAAVGEAHSPPPLHAARLLAAELGGMPSPDQVADLLTAGVGASR
ncbi:glycosyltransferase [Micromonospora sp. NPDC002575]|uniref:glycosyltransferase n=1 Tax=Micromonospora sp. NPDC002575 TaxID=3364222 RepID=UPI00368F3878